MKKINIKPNLRQFLTDKIKPQKNNTQEVPISNPNYNFMKKININNNPKKSMGKFSLLNSLKVRGTKKITKLIVSNNLKNIKYPNYNFSNNNNSFLKEIQNDCNNFRKSKTTDKIPGNNVNLLIGYQENQTKNNNKKIMIKQNNMKKYNFNISKIPKYENSSFKQAMKYYTLKSQSKTIQIEELSTYLRPMRNILGLANTNKIKTENSKNSSINIHNLSNFQEKNDIDNKDNDISNNSNVFYNKEILDEVNKDFNSIVHDEDIESKINKINEKDMENHNFYDMTFGKHMNSKSSINLTKNNKLNENKKNQNDIISNIANINTSLIKNCVFNNSIPHSQRNNKTSQIPFSIKIDKIDNTNKGIDFNNSKNKTSINNMDISINNIINSKNVSENDTQISTNNNLNNANQDSKSYQSQSQTLYQFRPRKIHLPKNGINLSSMHFKNQILQNILNKRKQKNKA